MTANNSSLPPLPPPQAHGPSVCPTIRLYLAVLQDLSPEQAQVVSTHVQNCPDCTREQRLIDQATKLMGSLSSSIPSARVDQAVMAPIAARSNGYSPGRPQTVPQQRTHKRAGWFIGQIAIAAVLLLTLLTAVHFSGLFPSAHQAFALPDNLSWNGNVLYLKETRIGSNGLRYRVTTYHVLGTQHMHVETTMDGHLDVVAVSDDHQMLGMDMMHHVAQWGANAWSVDDSMFNATELRTDLQTNEAIYLGKDQFLGQEVYRIRCKGGLVMLLNMHYQPVNVLRGAVGPGTGSPMYDTLELLPRSQVPDSLWDMSVPQNFQMGKLPEKP